MIDNYQGVTHNELVLRRKMLTYKLALERILEEGDRSGRAHDIAKEALSDNQIVSQPEQAPGPKGQ